MKHFIAVAGLTVLLSSCRNQKTRVVDPVYFDSFITHYSEPAAIEQNAREIDFWKKRIDPHNPGLTNEMKYAGALTQRFHLAGNINDLLLSDSILMTVDSVFAHKEAGPNLALAARCILQHRFADAGQYFNTARQIGLKNYDCFSYAFDIDFECGRYALAERDLERIHLPNDYGYFFRLAKLLHYKGDLKGSIQAMQSAVDNSGQNISLKQAALSNLADLYLHDGNASGAYENFLASIKLNSTDLHSLMGAGWIALVKDGNDSLAEKIFQFVATKTVSAEPLLKLIAVAEFRKDSSVQTDLARKFERIVTQPAYGNMYNKYLIDLYTGILDEPAKAEVIAARELTNRNTPQTQAWYVWTLYCNGKKDQAYNVYEQFVSEKPLEALELFWMGKFMEGINKKFNATQFYKAALKNEYDLSPGKISELKNKE